MGDLELISSSTTVRKATGDSTLIPPSVCSSPSSSSIARCLWVSAAYESSATSFNEVLSAVKSASFILLQGVPTHISLEAVRESINEVEGVSSLHEVRHRSTNISVHTLMPVVCFVQLHIWQLTEKTIVASVHVLVSRDTDYMAVADNIRKILHEYGVHSSTIQPEFAAEFDENSDNDVR